MDGMSLISPFVLLAGSVAGVAIAKGTRKPTDSILVGALRLACGLVGGFFLGLGVWIFWAWFVGPPPPPGGPGFE